MNIREELLKEKIHTKEHAAEIALYAGASAKNFKQLMQCFLTNEYRVAQRAAWSVSSAARLQPALIKPYLKHLAAQLQRTDVHPAIIRNSVRILEAVEIPKKLHGEIMNSCFGFIEHVSTPVAIKAFALTTLHNLSKQYPEILPELKLIIEDRWDNETAAFRVRGKKILQSMAGF